MNNYYIIFEENEVIPHVIVRVAVSKKEVTSYLDNISDDFKNRLCVWEYINHGEIKNLIFDGDWKAPVLDF